MSCKIHVYLINDHFSQEYADEHNDGKESELNRWYEWQDEMEIPESIDSIAEKENDNFALQGSLPSGEEFNHSVPKMHMFEIHCSSGTINRIGCSESILDKAKLSKENDTYKIEIWLKDYEPLANPIPGVYIAAQEFPKALIF